MNNDRRKDLADIRGQLEELNATFDDLKTRLEQCKDDEQEYYDNMPESLQGGEKGERAQAAVDALDEAYNALDEISFDDVIANIETACE